MIFVIIGLIIIVLVLVYLLARNIRFKKSIIEQLDYVKKRDTNQVLHTELNGDYREMVNQINEIISANRKEHIEFQRKNHDIEQMTTNISHDIRTPLASALGYIDIIRNQNIDEAEKERELNIIENRLKRMEELINQFFEFSKIISEEKEIEKEEVNIIAVLEESVAHFYDDYMSRNRKIELFYEKRKIVLNSNKMMLIRIFDNVINNALKHGDDDLYIKVAIDNNQGINEENIEKISGENDKIHMEFTNKIHDDNLDVDQIFDEFYTTDISRTRGSTGLGLAIVKQFVMLLGGSVVATKVEDKFSIIIDL